MGPDCGQIAHHVQKQWPTRFKVNSGQAIGRGTDAAPPSSICRGTRKRDSHDLTKCVGGTLILAILNVVE
jgi:hypothetical protein